MPKIRNVVVCNQLYTFERSVFLNKNSKFPTMEIAPNTVQLGMFPVDRADFEEIKEYLTTFGLTPNQIKVFFILENCAKSFRYCQGSQRSKK